jgi:hypothetical protein
MPAHHHDFVFQFAIGARNLGDGVEAVLMVSREFRLHIHLDCNRHIGFQQPVHATVIFNGRHGDGERLGVFPLVGEPAHAATTIIEDRSPGAAIGSAIAAWNHDACGMLSGKELPSLLTEFQLLDELLKKILPLSDVHRIFGGLLQIGVVTPLEQRLVDGLHVAHRAKEDDLSRQLPFVLFEIFLICRIDPNRVPTDGPWLETDHGSACAMKTAISGADMRTQVLS